jgi:hypothetical protein
MFKKGLVSIFFLPNSVQIIQLNSSKKSLIRKVKVDLPEGLIKNYRIVDPTALSQILKNTWEKYEIKEKTVGVVVPEFSTYTKTLTLPKLSEAELDEAVRYRMQEYLPKDIEQMALDWKVVDRAENTKVLVVAMDRDILSGYVGCVEGADLFPLVVETPSLSIARMCEDDPSGKLIFHHSKGEGLILMTKSRAILGSAVVGFNNKDEVVKTAKRISGHFDEDAEKIYISGTGIEESLVHKIQGTFNLPIEWIKREIKGLPEADVQDFMVPISLQFKETLEPADSRTINLLPVSLVEKYKNTRLNLQVWTLTLTVSLFVWLSFLVAIGAYLYLMQASSSLKQETQAQSHLTQRRTEAINQVKRINQIAAKVDGIREIAVKPQIILNDIERARPLGVEINKYDFNLEKGEVTLEGLSSDRSSLISFKQSLEGNEDIGSVTLPISSFEIEKDIEFEVKFIYLPGSIGNKNVQK